MATERKELDQFSLAALYAKHGNDGQKITQIEWTLNAMETELNRLSEELESKLKHCATCCTDALAKLNAEGALASLWLTQFEDISRIQAEMGAVKKLYSNLVQSVERAEKKAAQTEGGAK